MNGIPYNYQIEMNAPVTDPKHVTNKQYVDTLFQGLLWNPVNAATTGNIEGTSDAEKGTLTAPANGTFPTVDNVPPAVGNRYALWQQNDKSTNGLYALEQLGDENTPWLLRRTPDADASDEFRPDKRIYVLAGTRHGDKSLKQVTGSAITLGTSAIEFALDLDVNKATTETVPFTGDGAASSFVITHGLNTKKLAPAFYDDEDNLCMFGFQPLTPTTVRVTAGYVIPKGKIFTVVLVAKPE